ncbi:MAG: hypothetical protein HKN87_09975 [Saprospiraceae bacterium]|nr:hypothetical protein [Saprospiraceae bacterium]
MSLFSLCLTLHLFALAGHAQKLSPNSVLHRSLSYHDPFNRWDTSGFELVIKEARPGKKDRRRIVFFNIYRQQFHLDYSLDNHRLEYKIDSGRVSVLYDGSDQYTGEMQQKFKLSSDQAYSLRDYYLFLFGLPMKVRDPGAIWDPIVRETTFNGRPTWAIKVTYDPTVGDDIWHFYFDKQTFQIEGCRFFHDEKQMDGEYITFTDVKIINGIKFPKIRNWYLNKDDTFLGTDVVE